jgi:hypothetical protein
VILLAGLAASGWLMETTSLRPFAASLHRLDDLRVYVSRGAGYCDPPKRFGARSEIPHLRLVRAASSLATSSISPMTPSTSTGTSSRPKQPVSAMSG